MIQSWHDIGPLDAIPREGARLVRTPRGCLAVFRTAADEVFALEDRCPHNNGPLSDGIIHGRHVTCPLHNWVISLETGLAEGPDEGQTQTFPVKVEGGRLLLDTASIGTAHAA
jgi:nitrite reductase (NADH) small subunit